MKRLLIFHRNIAPYRIDMFNTLYNSFDTKVVLFKRNLTSQTFDYTRILEQLLFKPEFIVKEELGTLKWINKIWKELSGTKPDLVLTAEYNLSTIVTLIHKIVTRGKYKIVSIVDDSYNMIAEGNQFSKKHKYATKLLAPHLDDIINVEPRVAEWYQNQYGKGLYFPIICDDELARVRQERVLPLSDRYIKEMDLEGKKILLFVGRLVGLKNLPFAIDAFRKANIPESVFVIVGSGEDEQTLKTLIKEYDDVQIVGRYEGDNLYAWYNVAQIFTLPSIQEPFGAVTNEALVAGCKALISKNAGSNCLVKNGINGYVIDPYDEDGYIEALRKTMDAVEPLVLPLRIKSNEMQEPFDEAIGRVINRLKTI